MIKFLFYDLNNITLFLNFYDILKNDVQDCNFCEEQ